MKRIIAILCLLAGIAQAQSVIIVTNNILALPTVSTSVVAGTVRITEYLRQGANAIDINNNTGQVFVTDIRDGAPIFSFNLLGTNVVATNGQIRYAFTLTAGPTYDVRTFIYPQDGSPRYASGIYSLTVTSAPAGVSVTANITNDILVNATSTVNIALTNDITVNATSTVSLTSITTNEITVNNNITNIIQNIVESNSYFTTITGAVTSVNSATGAVTLTVSNTTNSAGVASWSGTVLSIGTNVPAASGGGISHWSSVTGTTTTAGSFLYPTSQVPVFSSGSVGFFVSTNKGISLTRPDGTTGGGVAIGVNAISLIPNHQFSATYGASSPDSIAIGTYATASAAGNTIAIGSTTIASGNDSAAIGYVANATAAGAFAFGRSSLASGQFSLALGGGDGTRNARATADRASAIGFRTRATNFGSVVIADGVDVDKGSQGGSNTITLAFDRGAYFTQTNTVYAAITRTNFVHSGNAGITVTQRFLDATSTIRTNVFVGGILVRGYTD